MTNDSEARADPTVTCENCEACCCRLEVLLITDSGVPNNLVDVHEWGARTMAQLDDGWCAALDRKDMTCRIYANRPWVCREFEMGAAECLVERAAHL